MPIAVTDVQQDVRESIRSWAAELDTSAVRARESNEPAELDKSWTDLAEIGVFSIALPEDVGGAGGGVADFASALEQTAEALVPGPILSTGMAGVLLARYTDSPAVSDVLKRIAGGRAAVAVAMDSGQLAAEETSENGLLVSGDVSPVLSASEASYLLLSARTPNGSDIWFILDAEQPGVRLKGRHPLDFSRSLATIALSDTEIAPGSVLQGLRTREVSDLAATLFAAEASGVAGWCLRTAVDHAKVREQFGSAIGSFQSVKHLCAEMLCKVEQAGALAWDAARTRDEEPKEHTVAAAAAGAVALDAAVDTAKDCIQVLGGTGFTWEHDAHLYLRRALALRQLVGGSSTWRRRTAKLALAGERRSLGVRGELPEDVERERPHARAEAGKLAALSPQQQRVRLSESGYLAPHWPKPYGLSAEPAMQLLIDDELAMAEVRRPDLVIGGWAVPTLLEHGTLEQQQRFVRPTLSGEITWCQLFSEPGAGSDLAALRTRAEREPGGWRLYGQKVWTSLAKEADWAICLARTDPEVSKHRGISYFLVDMSRSGIDVRPLRQITGEAVFSEVFLDGVFVSDGEMVGAQGDGWRLARTTLANERVAMGGGPSLGQDVERLLELARDSGGGQEQVAQEEVVGARVADGLSVSLLRLRATLRQLNGQDPGAQSSVEKLIGVRHRQSVAEAAVEFLGPDGAAVEGDSAVATHELLLSRCLSIAGGTTQVLLTVAGERILGLPRR